MRLDGFELTFREVSGLRPFVAAEVGGCPVSLMLHSNAGFRGMVTTTSRGAPGYGWLLSSNRTTASRRSAGSATAAGPPR